LFAKQYFFKLFFGVLRKGAHELVKEYKIVIRMKYANTILDTIGDTPLVKMNALVTDIDALVLAKYETFNPGNSIKDRMALKMVLDAEAEGHLKPGGTIIESTSGNTGMGLALAAVVKGYKLVCVMADKQSKEKMDILRAMGARVLVCPTNVAPEDPRSYYTVAKRLAEQTPNSWYVNQYDNLSNTLAHYESTGPEIWEQTDGKITHFVVGVGTGGTISGVGRYRQLKEHFKKDDVVVVLFHDHGSRYVGKMFNDDWMRDRGFLDESASTAIDLIKGHDQKPLVTVKTEELVSHAIERMRKYQISQIPVVDSHGFVGSIDETVLFATFLDDKDMSSTPIKAIMKPPYPIVNSFTSVDEIAKLIKKGHQAVIVATDDERHDIITKYDVISHIQ